MAKICRPIAEYQDIIISTGIELNDYKPPKKTIKRFIRLLKQVSDTRISNMIDYPLHEIILIVFLAVLGSITKGCLNSINRWPATVTGFCIGSTGMRNKLPSPERIIFSTVSPAPSL